MEPQQARMTFAVFMAFTVAIIFNALYLQKDAGFVVRGDADRAMLRPAIGTPLAGKTRRVPTKRDDLLRAVRRELGNHNYFPGTSSRELDGSVDAMTTGAVMAYQYDNDLNVTGLVSDALFKSFLFGVDNKNKDRKGVPSFSTHTHQLVAEIQGTLSAQGHYQGKIDGLFAGKTMDAIKRFESDRGLPVTGRVSGLLVQELTRLTGVDFNAGRK